MNVTIITAFPGLFEGSVRKHDRTCGFKGAISIEILDLREFGAGNYRQIDDYAFGGGGGMVLLPEVMEKALFSVRSRKGGGFVVYPSPQGDLLSRSC